MDWKKIGIKAAVTFVEALLASLVVIPVDKWTESGLLLALAGAVGAVLSFAYNTVKQYMATLDAEPEPLTPEEQEALEEKLGL